MKFLSPKSDDASADTSAEVVGSSAAIIVQQADDDVFEELGFNDDIPLLRREG